MESESIWARLELILKLESLIASLLILTTPPILATTTITASSPTPISGNGPSSGIHDQPEGEATGHATLRLVVGRGVRLWAKGAPSTSRFKMSS